MLATMARADRSARAEIMTSLASSMRSLFLARKARPHRAPAPADVRDTEEEPSSADTQAQNFCFLTSRVGWRPTTRNYTRRYSGKSARAPRRRAVQSQSIAPDKVDNERSHRLVLHSISQQRIVRMTVAVDLQSPSSITAENPAGRSRETPTSVLRRRWSPTPRVVEAAKTSGPPAGIPADTSGRLSDLCGLHRRVFARPIRLQGMNPSG